MSKGKTVKKVEEREDVLIEPFKMFGLMNSGGGGKQRCNMLCILKLLSKGKITVEARNHLASS